MTRLVACITVMYTLFAVPCGAQQGATGEIRSVLLQTVTAWNDGDVRAYMNGYWQSDSLVFVSGSSVTRGWQATLERYLRRYPTRETMGQLEFSDIEITPVTEGSAWVLGRWRLKRDADSPNGMFTLVVKRISGTWRIILDHTTTSID